MSAAHSVVVVGAGPAGLAAAAELGRHGVRATVLERGPEVGAAWRGRYDRLQLHTVRRLSGLPGYGIPPRHGRWPSRDAVCAYLADYAERHGLDVRTGVEVARIDRAGGGWRLATSAGGVEAELVVVATGHSGEPVVPDWPGREGFVGELVHAAEYRNPGPYGGRDVLVVGSGNSGAEIAVDLLEGGAESVRLSVRTPPHIVRRDALGLPSQLLGIALVKLPAPAGNRIAAVLRRLTLPDLAALGLPAQERPYDRFLETRRIPILDPGLVDAVRRGRIEVVPAVAALEREDVVLVDGRRLRPDAVVAATGYRPALEPLVGHLGVLDEHGEPRAVGGEPAAPGLWFIGFDVQLGGLLRAIGIEARRLARAVAA